MRLEAVINAYCKRINEVLENEVETAKDPITFLGNTVCHIGKCFETIRSARKLQETTAKYIGPLVGIMERVVKMYVEKMGEQCESGIISLSITTLLIWFTECQNALHPHSSSEDINTVLNFRIDPTLTSIERILNVATSFTKEVASPNPSPTSSIASAAPSSLPTTCLNPFPSSRPPQLTLTQAPTAWFFNLFLSLGCDPIHKKIVECNGRSLKRRNSADMWEEGWHKDGLEQEPKKLGSAADVQGWVELQSECEQLMTTFDRSYTKFERIFRPLSPESQDKVYSLFFVKLHL